MGDSSCEVSIAGLPSTQNLCDTSSFKDSHTQCGDKVGLLKTIQGHCHILPVDFGNCALLLGNRVTPSLSGKLVLLDLVALGATCGGETSQPTRQNECIDPGEPPDGSQKSLLSYTQDSTV